MQRTNSWGGSDLGLAEQRHAKAAGRSKESETGTETTRGEPGQRNSDHERRDRTEERRPREERQELQKGMTETTRGETGQRNRDHERRDRTYKGMTK